MKYNFIVKLIAFDLRKEVLDSKLAPLDCILVDAFHSVLFVSCMGFVQQVSGTSLRRLRCRRVFVL